MDTNFRKYHILFCRSVLAQHVTPENPVYEGEYRGRSGRTDNGGGWKTGNRAKRRAGKREKDCLMRAVFFVVSGDYLRSDRCVPLDARVREKSCVSEFGNADI